jgi:hypothetical protein
MLSFGPTVVTTFSSSASSAGFRVVLRMAILSLFCCQVVLFVVLPG